LYESPLDGGVEEESIVEILDNKGILLFLEGKKKIWKRKTSPVRGENGAMR